MGSIGSTGVEHQPVVYETQKLDYYERIVKGFNAIIAFLKSFIYEAKKGEEWRDFYNEFRDGERSVVVLNHSNEKTPTQNSNQSAAPKPANENQVNTNTLPPSPGSPRVAEVSAATDQAVMQASFPFAPIIESGSDSDDDVPARVNVGFGVPVAAPKAHRSESTELTEQTEISATEIRSEIPSPVMPQPTIVANPAPAMCVAAAIDNAIPVMHQATTDVVEATPSVESPAATHENITEWPRYNQVLEDIKLKCAKSSSDELRETIQDIKTDDLVIRTALDEIQLQLRFKRGQNNIKSIKKQCSIAIAQINRLKV